MPNIRPGSTSIRSYVTRSIRVSKDRKWRPTLLIEGMDDRTFFQCLARKRDISLRIDLASDIGDRRVTNNREKVEEVARQVNALSPDLNFIGFADREFDGFSVENETISERNVRRRYGKLIWSHGHSIENYLFDYQLMKDQLRRYYSYNDPCGYAENALSSMEEYFHSIMRIAAAVTWAAKEKGFIGTTSQALGTPLLDTLLASEDWRIIKHEDRVIRLDYDVLKAHIEIAGRRDRQYRKSDSEIEDFSDAIRNCYLPLMGRSDIALVQHLCHGHIGMALIRYAYAMFIENCWRLRGNHQQSDPNDNIGNMLMFSHWISSEDVEHSWVERYASPSGSVRESPVYCFEALGLME